MDTFRIDDIARRLLESVPPAFRTVQKDLESNFKAVLRASLEKLDLVTREEFEVQRRVLERTRQRLEALEAKVAAMELAAGGAGAGGPASAGAAGAPGAGDTAAGGGAGSSAAGPSSAT